MIEDLKKMLEDVKKHKRPKDELLEYYVNCRLNKSIQSYYKELLSSSDGLMTHNVENIIDKM